MDLFSWDLPPQQNMIDLEDPGKYLPQEIFSKDKRANLKQILTCLTCTEEYNKESTQPIVLPCGHTFCSKCMIEFGKKCPTCRAGFQNCQVKKNFIVADLLEELSRNTNFKEKEKCSSHKREIDRFCKTCSKLMCSVCHCEHIGSEEIISDENLRHEIFNIKKSIMKAEEEKEKLSIKIKSFLQHKKDEIDRREAPYKQRLERTLELEVKKFTKEKDLLVRKAEEIAREKIALIEGEKQKSIVEAEAMMKRQIELKKEEQKRSLESFSGRERRVFCEIEKNSLVIQHKIDALEAFEEIKVNSLEECVYLYQLWELQKYQYNEISDEIIAFNQKSIQSLLENNSDEKESKDQRERDEKLISDLVDQDLWRAWIRPIPKKINDLQNLFL